MNFSEYFHPVSFCARRQLLHVRLDLGHLQLDRLVPSLELVHRGTLLLQGLEVFQVGHFPAQLVDVVLGQLGTLKLYCRNRNLSK